MSHPRLGSFKRLQEFKEFMIRLKIVLRNMRIDDHTEPLDPSDTNDATGRNEKSRSIFSST